MRVRAWRARLRSPWLLVMVTLGAAGVVGLSADGLEQQWPAGDGLAMVIGVGEAYEQIPPI
jgi:hypothetical protein